MSLPHPLVLTTRDVAQQLGKSYYQVFDLLRLDRIPKPRRDSTGRYLWLPADIENVRQALGLAQRPAAVAQ